jgi:hypothetical protein
MTGELSAPLSAPGRVRRDTPCGRRAPCSRVAFLPHYHRRARRVRRGYIRSPRCQPSSFSCHASTSRRRKERRSPAVHAVARRSATARCPSIRRRPLNPARAPQPQSPRHAQPHELQWRGWRECSARPWKRRRPCARSNYCTLAQVQALYLTWLTVSMYFPTLTIVGQSSTCEPLCDRR